MIEELNSRSQTKAVGINDGNLKPVDSESHRQIIYNTVTKEEHRDIEQDIQFVPDYSMLERHQSGYDQNSPQKGLLSTLKKYPIRI